MSKVINLSACSLVYVSVHFLSSKITPQTLRAAITRNGGEQIWLTD